MSKIQRLMYGTPVIKTHLGIKAKGNGVARNCRLFKSIEKVNSVSAVGSALAGFSTLLLPLQGFIDYIGVGMLNIATLSIADMCIKETQYAAKFLKKQTPIFKEILERTKRIKSLKK